MLGLLVVHSKRISRFLPRTPRLTYAPRMVGCFYDNLRRMACGLREDILGIGFYLVVAGIINGYVHRAGIISYSFGCVKIVVEVKIARYPVNRAGNIRRGIIFYKPPH